MTRTQYDERLRQIQEDEAALDDADDELRRIQQTIRTSQRVRRDALPKLKKAGRVR